MILTDEIRALLQGRLLAHVTTINPDGYPHTVPIWYILDGDTIVIATGPASRKVKNIRVNPKGAVVVGGNPVNDHQSYSVGYLFQGDWAVEGEPGLDWIRRIALRYRDDVARVEREIAAWGPHQALRFTILRLSQVME
jgi:predicted pyridoxine 5'-phosphate oxidase superfamily flavin-nucleotide-binding protein